MGRISRQTFSRKYNVEFCTYLSWTPFFIQNKKNYLKIGNLLSSSLTKLRNLFRTLSTIPPDLVFNCCCGHPSKHNRKYTHSKKAPCRHQFESFDKFNVSYIFLVLLQSNDPTCLNHIFLVSPIQIRRACEAVIIVGKKFLGGLNLQPIASILFHLN